MSVPTPDPVPSEALREARGLVAPLAERSPAGRRALDRLERDLLPRTAGGDAYLVVGIVGPNNAGKSALFNALCGRDVSPSDPTGGATRRLIGAAPPKLIAELVDSPDLARFRLRESAATDGPLASALENSADPAELLLVPQAGLPEGLMLIDTPDFDSIFRENRLASESLLTVADVALAVVTRHSYQNHEVVTFLRKWLEHGRPWLLVYNEAPDADVAAAHTKKLGEDVGTPPLAAFWAPHDLAIAHGEATLDPLPLPPAERTLRETLFDLREVSELKARALRASLAALAQDLGELADELARDAGRARDLLEAAEVRALDCGHRVAEAAMPTAPFIAAFREVLDRRGNALSRRWRRGLRAARLSLERLPSLFRKRAPNVVQVEEQSLAELEYRELQRAWPAFFEELARDLGPEGRSPARKVCDTEVPDVTRLLDADLSATVISTALERAGATLKAEAADTTEFERECEALVEKAFDERGSEWLIQLGIDLVTLLPLATAGAVIIKTGGLGTDLAVLGGGAVSTYVMEKFAHLLGSAVTDEARERWTEIRGRQLARTLVDACLLRSSPVLRAAADEAARSAERVRELRSRFAGTP